MYIISRKLKIGKIFLLKKFLENSVKSTEMLRKVYIEK